jgi:hypothetical protein
MVSEMTYSDSFIDGVGVAVVVEGVVHRIVLPRTLFRQLLPSSYVPSGHIQPSTRAPLQHLSPSLQLGVGLLHVG